MGIKLIQVNALICILSISTTIMGQTSTSTSTATDYTGGAAAAAAADVRTADQIKADNQAALDQANATLAADQLKYNDAQAGLNRDLINQRRSELATAQAVCPTYVPGNGFDTFSTGTCSSQQAMNDIATATNNLNLALIPNYDPALVARLKAQVDADDTAVRQANYNKEYGMISANGASALNSAMSDINNTINTTSTDMLTNPDGILAPVTDAAQAANLKSGSGSGTYTTAESLYKEQLKKDVIMVIVGQITSRLNVCDHTLDLETALGAGQLFLTGEAAIYADNKMYQEQMKNFLNNTADINKQKEYLTKLLDEYDKMIVSATTKQTTRGSAKSLFMTAATQAHTASVTFATKDIACKTEAEMKAAQGINQAKEEKRNDDIAMIACSFAWCGACCAAPFVLDWATADSDQNSCSQGRDSLVQKIDDRTRHCNQPGTTRPDPVDMFRNYDSPSTTASKTIKDLCLSESDAIVRVAGGGCHNYTSNGGGPYQKCIDAAATFRQEMVACPVSILTDAAGAENTQAIVDTGIATGAVGAGAATAGGTTNASQTDVKLSGVDRAFIATSSLNIAKAVDLRLASPLQRSIIWAAFAQLAQTSADTNAQELNDVQRNRQHIYDLLQALNAQAGGVLANNALSPNSSFAGQAIAINGSGAINYKLPSATACITGVSSTSCKSVTDSAKAMPGFANLSPAMQTQSLNAATVLNSVNRTSNIDSTSLAAMQNFNNNSGAITNSYKKSLSQLQSVLKETGSNLNINSETNKMKSSVDSAMRSASQKIGSGSILSREFANSNIAESAGKNASAVTSKEKKIEPISATIAPTQIPSFESKTTASAPVANLKLSEENSLLSGVIDARNHSGKAKYEGNDEDSLFEKLTKAYIRNYDKVLTRKASAP